MNKLGRGLLADTAYQISKLYSFQFQIKRILKLVFLFLCFNLRPLGPTFDPQWDHMNKLGRDPQDDAIYQIWKLYVFQFQRTRTLKLIFFVPTFYLVTPGAGPFWPKGHHIKQEGHDGPESLTWVSFPSKWILPSLLLLIDWMVFCAVFNSISVISRRQLTLFMLSWVSPVLG